MISAKVIADSQTTWGQRLTTLELVFHRYILPEVNTYRMWSRSAASSRAIAAKRRIDEVRTNPAMPVRFGKNQKGMVAAEELEGEQLNIARMVWLEAAHAASDYAEYLADMGVAKELVNRIIEPFTWHTHVVSATDFSNCFRQRIPKEAGAMTEFQILASCIKDALEESTPETLHWDEWHLPYISEEEKKNYDVETLKKASAARVARTSYLTKSSNIEADVELCDRLLSAEPPHYAPFEMIATPAMGPEFDTLGNFDGWTQMRHLI